MQKGLLKKLLPQMDDLMAMQESLKRLTFTGKSANGAVKIVLKGTMELEDIKFDEQYIRSVDAKQLAKDIKKAYKDALKQLAKHMVGVLRPQ